MGYVAVTGGQDAIDASIELLREYRSGGKLPVDTEILRDRMKLLIDRVMSEAGLYAPDYAALALKQCEGSTEEAVFLLRAYRSTLSRNYTSRTVHGDEMHIRRRISSAFKDIPGGQMLGPTYDYVHRLLNFSLTEEKEEELQQWRAAFEEKAAQAGEVSLRAVHRRSGCSGCSRRRRRPPFFSPATGRMRGRPSTATISERFRTTYYLQR